MRIEGPRTTIPYQLAVLRDADFRAGRTHTRWGLGEAAHAGNNHQ